MSDKLTTPEDIENEVSDSLKQVLTERAIYEFSTKYYDLRIQEFEELIGVRKKYAKWIFAITIIWLVFVAFVIIVQGYRICTFTLSNGVMIAIITTSTANILGLLYIVLRFVYNPNFGLPDR